jgi:hypothetical protein
MVTNPGRFGGTQMRFRHPIYLRQSLRHLRIWATVRANSGHLAMRCFATSSCLSQLKAIKIRLFLR